MRGRRSKSKLLCGVAAGALASALGAPGAALAQPYDWTGFYVGAYAGGAWGHSNAVTGTTCPALGWLGGPGSMTGGYFCSVSTPASSANAAAVSGAGTGPASSSAFVGGGQAGYNWQANNIVYGVEADIGSFSLKASRQGAGVYPTNTMFVTLAGKSFTIGSSISTDWLFTARGRLGWTVDNWLLFVTGGLAVTNLQTSLNFSDTNAIGPVPGASAFGSNAHSTVGLALGAGAQYALSKNWSLKAEYLYVSFNAIDTTALVTHQGLHGYTNLLDTTQDLKAHMARVGVNYRF